MQINVLYTNGAVETLSSDAFRARGKVSRFNVAQVSEVYASKGGGYAVRVTHFRNGLAVGGYVSEYAADFSIIA